MSLSRKVTPLIRPLFSLQKRWSYKRDTALHMYSSPEKDKILKYYSFVPLKKGNPSYKVTTLFHKGWPNKKGTTVLEWALDQCFYHHNLLNRIYYQLLSFTHYDHETLTYRTVHPPYKSMRQLHKEQCTLLIRAWGTHIQNSSPSL